MARNRLCCLTLLALLARCDRGAQAQNQYERALKNGSTSPSIVKIDLLDARTGAESEQCVFGMDLIAALMIEHGWPENPRGGTKAYCMALKAPGHRFVFKNPSAIDRLRVDGQREELARGCAIIDQGHPASRGDMSGVVSEGEPDFPPEYYKSFVGLCD